jgi:hypothetical protein
MAYTFQQVDIIAFDIHTAIKPLAFPKLVKENFRFLVDQGMYGQQYESWQPIETDAFTIRPIKKREFSRNHFWKNYSAMSFAPDRDYWGLQIPFIFEPKNLDLKINMEGFDFRVELEPLVYLNSMGWSSNVKMRLSGDIKSERLQEFIGRLRAKEKKPLPFLIEGEGQGLTNVFKVLGRIVRNGIYTSPDTVGDTIAVSNELIISLARSTAPAKYFRVEWNLSPAMAAYESAEILSILYGLAIQPQQINSYLDHTLVTRFRGMNFSLTKFKLGTLLYMQEEAAKPADKIDSLDCLASNVRSSTMMSLAMDDFDLSASKIPKPHPVLEALQKQIKTTLVRLPDSYNNAYCRNFYRHHPRLKKLFQQEEEQEKTVEQ